MGEKNCKRCGKTFSRGPKLSDSQWSRRTFCTRRCAATRCVLGIDDMKRLYEEGKSSREISHLAGVSAQAVRRALKQAAVELRSVSDAMKLSHNKPGMAEKFSRIATGRKHSEATKEKMRQVIGPDHPLWRAGLTISSGGYLQFTASQANGDNAGRLLHQVIFEWKNGGRLDDGFHVHHIDGNKLNNHPDNLTSMSASDHAKLHMKQRMSKHA